MLNIYEDSEDGMEDENEMEQEQSSNDENEDDEVNFDEITHSLEDSQPDPSPSTAAMPIGSQPTQPVTHPKKPQKLNLQWKKKSLLSKKQQLRSLGNENLPT